MPTVDSRGLARTRRFFVDSRTVKAEPMAKVEGRDLDPQGAPTVKVLLVTDGFSCTEYRKRKGSVDPVHRHDDHETVGYLISGRIRMTIGGQDFVATPGSYWVHPAGVDHSAEIIEDSVSLEVKMPPTKTW